MQIAHAKREYVRWLRATRSISAHTLRAYVGDLSAFEQHLGDTARTRDLNRDHFIAFLDDQRQRGLTAATIKRRASGLRGFCRWLKDRGHLEGDPWSGVVVSVGRGRKLPRQVPASTLNLLLASLRERARTFKGVSFDDWDLHEATTLLAVTLMVATGTRVNELVNIRCQDIDIDQGTIRILGKGSRERQVYLTNDWLTRVTVDYLQARQRLAVGHDRLLFNRQLGPLTAPALRSRLTTVARAADLDVAVTPHMFRHTAATRLIEAGVDIRMIQTLLGHASLITTEIYTHVSNATLQRVLVDADVLGSESALR